MFKKKSVHLNFSTPKKSISLALWALLFLVILLILSQLIKIIISFGLPLNSDLKSDNIDIWKDKVSLNLVVKSQDISIINYDPFNKETTLLVIPNETYVTLPQGFGDWPVGSVYPLGQDEKEPKGAWLLKQSLAKLLGLPIDGFIEVNENDQKNSTEEIVKKWMNNPIFAYLTLRNMRSDLTLIESWKLISTLSQTRDDKFKVINLASSDITESKLLPDSSRVLGVDTIKLDLFIRDNLSDENIYSEGLTVAIYNGTTHFGLAKEASRVITNLGGNVIIAQNSENPIEKSLITINNKSMENLENSQTYKKLSQVFAPDCLKKSCTITDPKIDQSRSQIIIVLGEDYYLQTP